MRVSSKITLYSHFNNIKSISHERKVLPKTRKATAKLFWPYDGLL